MLSTNVIDIRSQLVKIKYKNWKGEISWRLIHPHCINFTVTEWHPEKQYILRAFDIGKSAIRDFAVCDILEWIKPTDNRFEEEGN